MAAERPEEVDLVQRAQRGFSDLWRNRPQGRHEVDEKTRQIVITFVQRQPRHPHPRPFFQRERAWGEGGDPGADQRGFAKTSGGGDKRYARRVLQPLIQSFDQASAQDNFGSRRGDE